MRVGGEVELWTAPLAGAEAHLSARLEVLTEAERTRALDLPRASRRLEHVTAWWLARRALAARSGLRAEDLRFERDDNGRPVVVGPAAAVAAGLRVSVSHTAAVAAVVVAERFEVGVDVERLDRPEPLDRLARRVFARSEREAWSALSEATRRARFFELWTLREAYLKARGLGMGAPLHAFAFDLDAPGGLVFSAQPDFEPRPEAWRFEVGPLGEDHRLAVAARCGPVPLVVRRHPLPGD